METENKFDKEKAEATLGEIPIGQFEKLKVSKMSKGYNWEVTILETNVKRIVELEGQMKEAFGDGT